MTKAAKRDLRSHTIKEGGVWRARIRLPWKVEDYVRADGEPVNYKTHAEAAQAGADAICDALSDNTTGFISSPYVESKEAKQVFKNFKGI